MKKYKTGDKIYIECIVVSEGEMVYNGGQVLDLVPTSRYSEKSNYSHPPKDFKPFSVFAKYVSRSIKLK